MDQKTMCLESFTKETFGALVHGLSSDGYVIDGREVLGIPFSSTQIEHMDQEILDQLCVRFDVNPGIEIASAGKFFSSQGAFYIIYDTSVHDYKSAQNILAKYVGGLPAY